jgi:hypothetical protein
MTDGVTWVATPKDAEGVPKHKEIERQMKGNWLANLPGDNDGGEPHRRHDKARDLRAIAQAGRADDTFPGDHEGKNE